MYIPPNWTLVYSLDNSTETVFLRNFDEIEWYKYRQPFDVLLIDYYYLKEQNRLQIHTGPRSVGFLEFMDISFTGQE